MDWIVPIITLAANVIGGALKDDPQPQQKRSYNPFGPIDRSRSRRKAPQVSFVTPFKASTRDENTEEHTAITLAKAAIEKGNIDAERLLQQALLNMDLVGDPHKADIHKLYEQHKKGVKEYPITQLT